jgi:uncharacterized protein YdeI (YjbR/CyaY-like superfamily)
MKKGASNPKADGYFGKHERWESELRKLRAIALDFPLTEEGYLLHFSSAKQSKTREARVQKCMGRILEGKGLDDQAVRADGNARTAC